MANGNKRKTVFHRQSRTSTWSEEMKRLMLTAAAFALLTTAAHADDVSTAKGMMIASLYDDHCEKIPGLEPKIKALLAVIPASSMRLGMDQAKEYFQSMSTDKFCEATKSFVASAMGASQ
jgi:hypothetical protein